jgi:hypothetical protein
MIDMLMVTCLIECDIIYTLDIDIKTVIELMRNYNGILKDCFKDIVTLQFILSGSAKRKKK